VGDNLRGEQEERDWMCPSKPWIQKTHKFSLNVGKWIGARGVGKADLSSALKGKGREWKGRLSYWGHRLKKNPDKVAFCKKEIHKTKQQKR